MYNIIRISSQKFSKEVKVDDDTMVNSMCTTKLDPEKVSSCSIEASITIEDTSQTKDDVKHTEIECTIPDEQVEVVEYHFYEQ